ncbi:MAG: hypothetical protein ACFHU9_05680 [Fluviicola sp.]
MRLFLFLILLFSGVNLNAQEENILAGIQSRGCDSTIIGNTDPRILSVTYTEDTASVQLYVSSNCGGYHNPKVILRNDSIFFTLEGGTPMVFYDTTFIVDEKKVHQYSFQYNERYRGKIPSDTLVTKQDVVEITACNCCFFFELKLAGLKENCDYTYMYFDTEFMTESDYQAHPERLYPWSTYHDLKLPYCLKTDREKVEKTLLRKCLKYGYEQAGTDHRRFLKFQVLVDTNSCKIKEVRSNSKNYPLPLTQELEKYLQKQRLTHCPQRHNGVKLEWFELIVGINEEQTRLFMDVMTPLRMEL